MAYWEGGQGGGRTYHHTAPVNAMYGLHEALLMVKEEGLEQSWEKHRTTHASLYENLSGLGLEFVVDASYRLPQLNLVKVPEGVDEAAVRKQLLQQFNLEIGAGLGAFAGKVWRIGLMGYSARQENVQLCTSALRACLPSS
jgi:alanine-glyoxylate transaminase/serine-glyoxylate transaminase/serine-pyruvate transaminase